MFTEYLKEKAHIDNSSKTLGLGEYYSTPAIHELVEAVRSNTACSQTKESVEDLTNTIIESTYRIGVKKFEEMTGIEATQEEENEFKLIVLEAIRSGYNPEKGPFLSYVSMRSVQAIQTLASQALGENYPLEMVKLRTFVKEVLNENPYYSLEEVYNETYEKMVQHFLEKLTPRQKEKLDANGKRLRAERRVSQSGLRAALNNDLLTVISNLKGTLCLNAPQSSDDDSRTLFDSLPSREESDISGSKLNKIYKIALGENGNPQDLIASLNTRSTLEIESEAFTQGAHASKKNIQTAKSRLLSPHAHFAYLRTPTIKIKESFKKQSKDCIILKAQKIPKENFNWY